jgi:predicted O-methyltransferase YrrM
MSLLKETSSMNDRTASIYEKLSIPEDSRHTSISAHEGEYLFDLLRARGYRHTIETGLAWGSSAAHILAATVDSPHVCIDPYQEESYGNQGMRNLSRLGFAARVELFRTTSAEALPLLVAERRQFDFAFVDGSHRFDDVLMDWYFFDRMLEIGGVIVFDDSWMRSVQLTASFVERNRADYRRVASPPRNFAVFERIARDRRRWDHFEEFYNRRGIRGFQRYKTTSVRPSTVAARTTKR